jgi:hypothetical protein
LSAQNVRGSCHNRWFHSLLTVDYCCAFNFIYKLEIELLATASDRSFSLYTWSTPTPEANPGG